MPMKMPNFIQKILSASMQRIRFASNLRPSVIGGKMLSEENNNFISKYMVLSFGKILSFYRTKK
jgi:hypothetical protein